MMERQEKSHTLYAGRLLGRSACPFRPLRQSPTADEEMKYNKRRLAQGDQFPACQASE